MQHNRTLIMTERAAKVALARHEAARRTGERVKFAREANGVTQVELGHVIGRSSGTVYNIEVGRRALTGPELVSISRVLGCSVGWLRGGRATSPQLHAPAQPEPSNLMRELERALAPRLRVFGGEGSR